MSIPSKTRKDQKAHELSSNLCEKRLKPMKIATKTQKMQPRPGGNVAILSPSVGKHCSLTRPHSFASPARSHDTNTKRNRNRFPDWGSPASINSPQSPIFTPGATKSHHGRPERFQEPTGPSRSINELR